MGIDTGSSPQWILGDVFLIWGIIEWDLLWQNKCRLRIMQLPLEKL